jgi:dTDP-4-dehydrorhamnose reductase
MRTQKSEEMMTERIPVLVTGGKGMLGSALALEAARFPRLDVRAPGREELDVRDAGALAGWADWVCGGWIVHCAARVDVEGCAREPEEARRTIVEGTANAVALARQAGARFLYPQSFLVYDGRTNPIAEDETPRPLSLYGELKYEAEKVVTAALPEATIVRMAGFFGGEASDKNFVGRIIPVMQAAMARGETRFEVGTRIWQPTWTRDLAYNTLLLLSRGGSGHYQMACQDAATFADIAHEIVAALGWSERLEIVPVDASAVSGSELGRRPDKAVLSCARLKAEHLDLQRAWRPTLHAYLDHPFFDQYRLESTR